MPHSVAAGHSRRVPHNVAALPSWLAACGLPCWERQLARCTAPLQCIPVSHRLAPALQPALPAVQLQLPMLSSFPRCLALAPPQVVSLHCPLFESNFHLMNQER